MEFPIFILLIFLALFINITPEENIIFAWQMNRHGARAPYLGVKDGIDAYKENWTQIEELSEVGRRMLYLLGVKARKRYVEKFKLLSEKYNPQEIYIRSTDVNRTIESILSFIQGLYPEGTGPLINEKILNNTNITYPPNKKYTEYFEEIINKYNLTSYRSALPFSMSVLPVHLFYKPDHEFQLYDTNLCKGHKEKYEEQKQRKAVKEFGDHLLEKFDFLYKLEENDTVDKNEFLHDYWNLYKYMDGFICDYTDQRKFKYLYDTFNFTDEAKELLKSKSEEFLLMDYNETNFPEGYDNISIVSNSHIMHSLVNWMEKAIEGNKKNNSYIKYVIYSAHDASIGALEHFMSYAFDTRIDYARFAETRFFELYIEEGQDEPKVRYLTGENEEKKDISFKKFKEIIDQKSWNDTQVAEFCQFEEYEENKKKEKEKKDKEEKEEEENNAYIVLMIILLIINLMMLLILIILCIKK